MTIKSESLDKAIRMEEKGYKFYSESLEEVDNKFSRKVLKSLAQQELEHKKRFQDIAEGKNISAAGIGENSIEDELKGIFEQASTSEKEEWKKEETEIYEKALEMEKKTYNFYKELAEESDNQSEKEFLEALMKEESQHEESIQNVLYYLTDQTWWLADEESKTWNWMNI
ncbi:MAG: ferritin-like domain-containing protein [Bacillota bacterium]